jgi:uncharacterized protein (TIGR02996 family)
MMRTSPDLPPTLLHAITEEPDEGEHWHALADWLWIHGREDEAAAVRILWPTLLENLTFASLESTLEDVARNAKVLGKLARAVERRTDETRPDETRTDQAPGRDHP